MEARGHKERLLVGGAILVPQLGRARGPELEDLVVAVVVVGARAVAGIVEIGLKRLVKFRLREREADDSTSSRQFWANMGVDGAS